MPERSRVSRHVGTNLRKKPEASAAECQKATSWSRPLSKNLDRVPDIFSVKLASSTCHGYAHDSVCDADNGDGG